MVVHEVRSAAEAAQKRGRRNLFMEKGSFISGLGDL
jgi:hypothetical protein